MVFIREKLHYQPAWFVPFGQLNLRDESAPEKSV